MIYIISARTAGSVPGYGLYNRAIVVRFLTGAKVFLFSRIITFALQPTQLFIKRVSGVFRGGKETKHETDI